MVGLVGKKLGMTRVFDEKGIVTPVTVIEAGACRVTQVKTEKSDGYNAVQLGYGKKKEKNVNKPELGHLNKAVADYVPAGLKEFRLADVSSYELGQDISVEIFAEGENVKVSGVTKGRGFQGVVKRHGFSGGDETHGNTSHRVPGSIGQCADPSRVFKNKKLPGQYGNANLTVKNLKIVKVDAERGYIFVKGAVPGPTNGTVTVTKC